MTLKEKFEEIELNLSECSYQFIGTEASNQCEKIADEFAIGFAEFLYDCALNETLDNKSLKELLEIYKKEKGL